MAKSTTLKRSTAPKPSKAPTKTSKAAAAAAPEVAEPEKPNQPRGKLGIVVGMLRRPEGARVPELQEATGWQAHSIRGAMSGAIKKKLGLEITSSAGEGGRVYRIADQG